MGRPFESIRPFGPFVFNERASETDGISVSDLRQLSQVDDYDPVQWVGKTPERLYHNTDEAAVKSILSSGKFDTQDVFLGANVGEVFGDFTLIFDGESAIDSGFSPRTYIVDEEEIYKEENNPDIFKTDKGVIWNERHTGCYPKSLWDTFDYSGAESRCNPNLDYPFDVYITTINEFAIRPTGTLEVNKPHRLDLSGIMQQTFALALGDKDIQVSDVGLEYIMYTDAGVNDIIAENMADAVGVEAISNDKAVEMFPELTSDTPVYDMPESLV